MYNDYFGFKEDPFSITPDPQFLYMSERHREALAHLLYGLKTDGGFVLLTGEVGTGKTTVCRCLLEQIPENSEVAFILNPRLTVAELLATICDELRISYPRQNTSVKVFVDAINSFLLDAHSQGRKTVLIIDEAQNLSVSVLEQIRLLTNLETHKKKLLQVIMLGQPELKQMLECTDLRQLAQRITARYHLEPLSKNEIKAYINHRLLVAGLERPLFPPATIRKLYRLSGGVPRLINLLCDRALLGAYVKEQQAISPRLLQRAAQEVLGTQVKYKPGAYLAWQWLLPILIVFAGSLLLVAGHWDGSQRQADSDPPAVFPQPSQLDKLVWDDSQPITQSDVLAYQTLFSLWGISYSSELGTARDQAFRQGLYLLDKQGSLGRLRQLNRPAVLKLTDTQGQEFFATLTALSERAASLVVGTQLRKVPITTLTDHWFGEFVLLWRPPAEYQGALKPGDRGQLVQWLDVQLALFNQRGPRSKDDLVLNGELLEELQRFQSEVGLVPDGVVGPYTLIQVNNRLGSPKPTLTSGTKG